MLNVTKELTALARKLGYTGTAPDTVAKAINAITASVGEGGGEGGGGCDCKTMVVHSEEKENDVGYTIFDATAGEIFEAAENGYAVFLIHNRYLLSLSDYNDDTDVILFYFTGVSGSPAPPTMVLFVFNADSSDAYPSFEEGSPK